MSDDGHSIKVDTRFNSYLIEQDTYFMDNGIRKDISKNIVKLQDDGIREALIKLGWTPPEDPNNQTERLNAKQKAKNEK